MNIKEFNESKKLYNEEYLQLLSEVAGSHRLSKKIEKLIHKINEKKVSIPSDDWPDLKKVIDFLKNDLLGKIKSIEKEYEKGNLNAKQVAYRLKKYRGRALQVKKVLQEKKILNKFDWQNLIYLGLSLLWIPSALAAVPGFVQMFGAQPAPVIPSHHPHE
jgi:hypothetical protein